MAHLNYENTYSLEPAFIDRTDNGRFYNKFYFWTSKYKKKIFFSNSIKNFFWGGEATHRIILIILALDTLTRVLKFFNSIFSIVWLHLIISYLQYYIFLYFQN
jgi:hypothetical protein